MLLKPESEQGVNGVPVSPFNKLLILVQVAWKIEKERAYIFCTEIGFKNHKLQISLSMDSVF